MIIKPLCAGKMLFGRVGSVTEFDGKTLSSLLANGLIESERE